MKEEAVTREPELTVEQMKLRLTVIELDLHDLRSSVASHNGMMWDGQQEKRREMVRQSLARIEALEKEQLNLRVRLAHVGAYKFDAGVDATSIDQSTTLY